MRERRRRQERVECAELRLTLEELEAVVELALSGDEQRGEQGDIAPGKLGISGRPTPVRWNRRRGRFGQLAQATSAAPHASSTCSAGRGPFAELPIDRDDVIAIFDALADIKAWTFDIWRIVGGEANDEEEAES